MFCEQMQVSELLAKLNSESELTDDELLDVLKQIVHCKSDDFPDDLSKCKLLELLALLREPRAPFIWLHTCVILGHICSKFTFARVELARLGVLSCLAKVISESLASLASVTVSEDNLNVYAELVRFIMVVLVDHFSRGSSLCIRKLLQYDVLAAVLSAVDYFTPALFDSAVSGMFLKSNNLALGATRYWHQ